MVATTSPVESAAEASAGNARRLGVGWRIAAGVVVATCFSVGLGLRVWILDSYIGFTNSDEATTGLMALGVVRGHLPVLVAGNAYGGTLESFIAAPVFAVTGASEVWLKGLNLAEWLLAAVLLYFVARLVLGRLASLASACIFWVASAAIIYLSTLAYAGYATGICAYLAAFLVIGYELKAERPNPWLALLGGALAGVAVWLHPMFVALMAPALVVGAIRYRKAIVRWWLPTGLGVLAALSPMIAYNISKGWPSLDDPYPQFANVTYVDRLVRFAAQLGPRALGQRDLDGSFADRQLTGDWIFGGLGKAVYFLVLAAAVAGLVVLLRRSWPGIMLAASAFVAPFILAAFGALSFYDDGRYSINFIVFAILGVVAAVDAALRRLPTMRRAALLALPIVWLLVAAVPSTRNIVPAIDRGPDDEMIVLTRALDAAGIDRVLASYWIAYRLDIYTDERIKAAVVPQEEQTPRFPYLQEAVAAADPHEVAWVFGGASPLEPDPSVGLPIDQYDRQVVGPYVVYIPRNA